eukprot:scaffold606_cov180-Amphora_coffeaeformis.AAC.4
MAAHINNFAHNHHFFGRCDHDHIPSPERMVRKQRDTLFIRDGHKLAPTQKQTLLYPIVPYHTIPPSHIITSLTVIITFISIQTEIAEREMLSLLFFDRRIVVRILLLTTVLFFLLPVLGQQQSHHYSGVAKADEESSSSSSSSCDAAESSFSSTTTATTATTTTTTTTTDANDDTKCLSGQAFQQRVQAAAANPPTPPRAVTKHGDDDDDDDDDDDLRGVVDDVLSRVEADALVRALPPSYFTAGAGYEDVPDQYAAPAHVGGLGLNQLYHYQLQNHRDDNGNTTNTINTSNNSSNTSSLHKYDDYDYYDQVLEFRERVRRHTERALQLCPGTLRVEFTQLVQKTTGGNMGT